MLMLRTVLSLLVALVTVSENVLAVATDHVEHADTADMKPLQLKKRGSTKSSRSQPRKALLHALLLAGAGQAQGGVFFSDKQTPWQKLREAGRDVAQTVAPPTVWGGALMERTGREWQAVGALKTGAEGIIADIGVNRAKATAATVKGFAYERAHEATFMADGIRKRWDHFIRLGRTDTLPGKVNDPVVDLQLLIKSGNRDLATGRTLIDKFLGGGYQAKTGVTAAGEVAKPQYWETGKLVPTDTMLKANRAGKGTLAKAQAALAEGERNLPKMSFWQRLKLGLLCMAGRQQVDKSAKQAGNGVKNKKMLGVCTTWEQVAKQQDSVRKARARMPRGHVMQELMQGTEATDRVVGVRGRGQHPLVWSRAMDSEALMKLTNAGRKPRPNNNLLLNKDEMKWVKHRALTRRSGDAMTKLGRFLRCGGRVLFWTGLASATAPHACGYVAKDKTLGRAVFDTGVDVSGIGLVGDGAKWLTKRYNIDTSHIEALGARAAAATVAGGTIAQREAGNLLYNIAHNQPVDDLTSMLVEYKKTRSVQLEQKIRAYTGDFTEGMDGLLTRLGY